MKRLRYNRADIASTLQETNMKATDHAQALNATIWKHCDCCAGKRETAHRIVDTQRAEEVGNVYQLRCSKCGKKSWTK